MADEKVTHETIEKWCAEQPKSVLDRLPDVTETREAKRLVKVAADLAHQVVERAEAAEARRQE